MVTINQIDLIQKERYFPLTTVRTRVQTMEINQYCYVLA